VRRVLAALMSMEKRRCGPSIGVSLTLSKVDVV
jgi:hypothetical protein